MCQLHALTPFRILTATQAERPDDVEFTMIDYKELFSAGASFEQFATTGLPAEINAVKEAQAKLASAGYLSETLKTRMGQIEDNYYLLTAAELWCPDCQRNVTAMATLCQLQPRVQQAIISKSRAERSLLVALDLDKVRVPFTVILNADFAPIGTFVEQPQKVIAGDDNVRQQYRQGLLLDETLSDILAVIEKHQAA